MCEGISIGGNVSIQISGSSIPPDGTVTAAKISSGAAGDGQVLTADGAGGAAWEAAAGGGPGYLVYVALISQDGDPTVPVATVLENTLGGAVVWTRVNPGDYVGTLAGAFPSGKVFSQPALCNSPGDNAYFARVSRLSDDTVSLRQGNPFSQELLDGMTDVPIEIRVYP